MPSTTWTGTAGSTWEIDGNSTANAPGPTTDVVIPSAFDNPPNGPLNPTTIKSLTIADGGAGGFDGTGFVNLTLSNVGATAATFSNVTDLNLKNVTGKIAELTGTGTNVTISNLTGSANYSGDCLFTISAGNGSFKYNSDALETSTQTFDPSYTGTIIADTVTVHLSSGNINAAVTLTSINSGKFVEFTQLRAAASQAKYATVTGGVEQSHTIGTVYHGTYDGGFGNVPTKLLLDQATTPVEINAFDGLVISGGTSATETWSVTLATTGGADQPLAVGSHTVTLQDENHGDNINLDTITVTAASAGGAPSVGGIDIVGGLNAGQAVSIPASLCVE